MAHQIHKELQDTMAQLDAILHEIRSLSMLNPATTEVPEKLKEDKNLLKVPKDSCVESSIPTNTVSEATAYARLAEAAVNANKHSETKFDKQYDNSGLLSVFPVSAESAGLLPKHKGSPHGSDILLEAIIEAEVAHNVKDFFSQPQDPIPHDRE